jgi:hypothetical protein
VGEGGESHGAQVVVIALARANLALAAARASLGQTASLLLGPPITAQLRLKTQPVSNLPMSLASGYISSHHRTIDTGSASFQN